MPIRTRVTWANPWTRPKTIPQPRARPRTRGRPTREPTPIVESKPMFTLSLLVIHQLITQQVSEALANHKIIRSTKLGRDGERGDGNGGSQGVGGNGGNTGGGGRNSHGENRGKPRSCIYEDIMN